MGNVLTEEGYIVYTRETASYKWEKIRQFKQKEVENLMGKIPNANDNYWLKIADNLEALGKNERARELALLQQGLGQEVSVDDEYKFIDQFNQVIIGVDLYERALKQIKLSKQQFDEGKKTMAPVISSLYMSKLKTRLGKTLVQFVQEHEQEIISNNLDKIDALWRKEIEEAVLLAFEDLANYVNKNKKEDVYGTEESHTYLLEEFSRQRNKNIFYEIVSKKINLEKTVSALQENLEKIQNALNFNNMRGIKSIASKSIGTERGSAGRLGGSVDEFINQLVQSMGNSIGNLNRGAKTLMTEMAKTDNVLIFTEKATVSIEEIIDDLDEKLSVSKNLIEAEQNMSDYWENNLSKLEKGFVVFTSGKAYSATSFYEYGNQGFKNGSSRPLSQLPTILSQSKGGSLSLSERQAKDFLTVLLNSIDGAVLDVGSNKTVFEKDLRAYLFNAMAYLLFDDWINLGAEVGDLNAIHAFTLDDIEVPLSFLLLGAARAIRETATKEDWFSVELNLPKQIMYPSSTSWLEENYPKIKGTDHPDVKAAWEKQRVEALKQSSFTTYFLGNFYNEIMRLGGIKSQII